MPRLHPLLLGKRICMMMVEHFLRCAKHLHNKSIQWMMSYMHSSTCPESIHIVDSEQLRNHSMAIRLISVRERERVQDWVEENQKGEVPKVNEETAHAQQLSLFTNISQCFDQCSTKI